jgi:hypothetical protein
MFVVSPCDSGSLFASARTAVRAPRICDVVHAAILQVHLESGGDTESRDLGEVEPEDDGVLDLRERAVRLAENRVELCVGRFALVPWLEPREYGCGTGLRRTSLQQAQSRERDRACDTRLRH